MEQKRRLAAIMFTDIVGFSRLTNQNPLRARELNEDHRKIVRSYLEKYEGFERETTGDGFFTEFQSAIQALSCAIEIQHALHDRNMSRSSENQVEIRIGLHLGDIIEKNNEIFGDGVNIAARLEPLAEAGGICISKTFYDLVKSNWSEQKFSSLGTKNLKNIQGSIELFRFNFPWNKKRPSRFAGLAQFAKSIFSQEQWSLASLFVLGVGLLVFILAKVFFPQFQNSARNPSAHADVDIKLDGGWTYSTDHQTWNELIPKESWRYADAIQGNYELKKEISIVEKPLEPAIILGLISDSHRVYLNDQLIGGSEAISDLAVYQFDASLLKVAPGKNTLIVKGYTRPNLNPGLILIEDTAPQLGEFKAIKELHAQYFFKFFILKNIYFVFSFIIFALSLTYALYLKNKSEVFYSSLFLLLGCLGYSYYNPWVNSTFDYQFLRFLRVSCTLMSSLILYSGYLVTRGKKSLAVWNNTFALLAGIFSFTFLNFYHFESAKGFVSVYNSLLLLGLLYLAPMLISSLIQEISQRKELYKKDLSAEAYLFLGFTFFSLLNILGTFKNSQYELFFSALTRARFNDVGVSLPFIFAIVRVSVAVFEFTQQKYQNMLNKRKDEFFIEITRVVSGSQPVAEKIELIQNLAQHFLRAEKSSLYLLDSRDPKSLRLHSSRGHTSALAMNRASDEGVYGYVLQNRRPLLIEDIQQDDRFHTGFEEMKSGSCMVFPLIVEDQVLGVMSFLDKENNQKFEMRELESGLKMSSFVSLLISSSKDYLKAS